MLEREDRQMSHYLQEKAQNGGALSTTERTLSVAGGLVLAAVAAQPRPNMVLSVLALAAGAFLAYRGATGYCPVSAALADRMG